MEKGRGEIGLLSIVHLPYRIVAESIPVWVQFPGAPDVLVVKVIEVTRNTKLRQDQAGAWKFLLEDQVILDSENKPRRFSCDQSVLFLDPLGDRQTFKSPLDFQGFYFT